MKYNYIDIS